MAVLVADLQKMRTQTARNAVNYLFIIIYTNYLLDIVDTIAIPQLTIIKIDNSSKRSHVDV